jgi:PAS domain S-box-containing protein
VKSVKFFFTGIFSLVLHILISTSSASGLPTDQPGIDDKTNRHYQAYGSDNTVIAFHTTSELSSDSLSLALLDPAENSVVWNSSGHFPLILILFGISLFVLGFFYFKALKTRRQNILSEQRFRILLEANPSAIMIFQNFKLKYVNTSLEQLTGYSRLELLQMEVWQLIHPNSFNHSNAEKISVDQDGFSFRGEFEILTRGKNRVWIDMSTRSINFDDKPAVLATAVDITERKLTEERLSESELRYKTFFSENSASILIIDPQSGIIVDANQAALNYYGYSKAEMLHMNISDIQIMPETKAEIKQDAIADQALLSLRHRLADGSERDVEIYRSLLRINSNYFNYCLIFDVTERRIIEKELKEAKEQAEEANKVKSFFVSTVSHEIRTPLNAIIGLTDLIIEGERLSDEQMKYMQSIKFSSDHLLGIINDVLDFSKLEAGKVSLEIIDFDLINLVSECVKTIEFKARDKNILVNLELDASLPPVLKGDPSRLRQIMLNLLSNALKFTDEGHIDVHVKLEQLNNDHVEVKFSVSDTGKGIAPDKQGSLFQSFTQAEADTSRKYGGTGLGLSICKKLVELQKGHIGLKSIEGMGSTFWFTLSYLVSDKTFIPDRSRIASIQRRELKGVKILLAEDDKMNQFVMKKTLEKWQVELDIAQNGKEAVEKLARNTYNLVLMDLHMPELDGYEAISIIRDPGSAVLNHHIPVIALTADVTPETRIRVKEAGMNDLITKPSEQGIMYEKIVAVICNEKSFFVEKTPEEKIPEPDHRPSIEKTKRRITKALTDIFDDDVEGIVALIVKFLKEIPWTIVGINEAFFDHDMDTLGKLVHKIKPGYSYLGFNEVSEKITRIQELAKEGIHHDRIEILCKELDEDSRNIISILREVHKDFISENSMKLPKQI